MEKFIKKKYKFLFKKLLFKDSFAYNKYININCVSESLFIIFFSLFYVPLVFIFGSLNFQGCQP